MSRSLFYVLVLPLLGAEIWAQFVAHDQQIVTLTALLALAVIAVRWATLPRPDAECPADCPKCRESESLEGDR
ncbi:hypothetical protein [Streptomyces sp. NPDC093808]|uniref:hypothetical protein n=1 Tax=Streptomyces sp. NPDC093808 TaxID=3154985 RepID=UPI0034510B4B